MMRPFATRLTRCPIAHDPAAATDTRLTFADLPPDLTELLAATAGCSPYLRGLMRHEGEWLRAALTLPPEQAFADLLTLAPQRPDDLAASLRLAKRRAALLVALADLGGVWALEQVTGALTKLADRAVSLSVQALVADEIRRGK
ncbi:MAG: glutamine-synthetase adenylyltransferase, partial [Paracoccaceae bacterium]